MWPITPTEAQLEWNREPARTEGQRLTQAQVSWIWDPRTSQQRYSQSILYPNQQTAPFCTQPSQECGLKRDEKKMTLGTKTKCMLSRSAVSDSCVTPRTVACQAPLSRGFPRQEYWSHLLLQRIFPNQASNPHLLHCRLIHYH